MIDLLPPFASPCENYLPADELRPERGKVFSGGEVFAGTNRLAATGDGRIDFCGSTGLGARSMYVFMVSVFLLSVVWGVSPTTCGSAPLSRCNPRSLRRADTPFTFIASHTV